MIDLHLHLDGSLTPNELISLAKTSGIPLPTTKEKELFALMTFDGRGTLNDYLKKFVFPLSVMQSGETVAYAFRSLADRLFRLGYSYAEVRFAPMLHTRKGATEEEIVQGALKGLRGTRIPIGVILCCMRGFSREENIRVVELAASYREKGVVGVDLAGAEALYPTENYREVFSLASELGLNITIHAGEAAGEESIRAALDFGAKRIGHGVAAKSEDLLARLKREDILLEVCPTSNVQTGAVPSLSAHPIKRFLDLGIPVALCSDNMTVSDTDVPREWEKVKAAFSFRDGVLDDLTATAAAHAFGKGMGK